MNTHPERLIAREADACALDAGERRELQAHLEVCTACREALESQRTVARLLRARAAVQPRPGFSALVSARIDRENGDGFLAVANWRAWTVGLAPVAAALVLMAYLGVGAASATSTDAAVTFETWAAADAASTPASVFLQPSASGDQLLEAVLTGAVPSSSGESPDVR